MTTVKVEGEPDIEIDHVGSVDTGTYVTLWVNDSDASVWLSADEARKLVKALKKHIKKAEGK